MNEYTCWEPAWEDYLHSGSRAHTEDEWWGERYEEQAAAEADAMIAAISSADLYEFDSEEDRDAYILEAYEDRLAELAYEKGR